MSRSARDNPFASHRVEALPYRWPGFSWPALLARLGRLGDRGAIVGAHGCGKTTLLDGLEERLRRERAAAPLRLTLRREHERPARRLLEALARHDLAETIVIVDGAEQLGAVGWQRLRHRCRGAAGLIITSHREGRLPTVHTCRTSPELLVELVAELAPDLAGRAGGLPALWAEHGGNLRFCLRALYDRVSLRGGR